MGAALAPVIAIDGPSASGKGTIAMQVAQRLGFHYLDSGALYRLVALAASRRGVSTGDEPALALLTSQLDVAFHGDKITLNQEVVSDAIRTEAISVAASTVAGMRTVRQALLTRQRAFRQPPGLVAEGRDMGSVVFPDATLKIYLTADAGERAKRRHKQLIEKGMDANMATLLQELRDRDERDRKRAVAPLQKCDDARLLDTTKLTIEAAVAQVLAWYAAPRVS